MNTFDRIPVVAIGGGAGAGKSELARALSTQGFTVLHLDDFYHEAMEAGVTVEKLDGSGRVLDRGHPESIDLHKFLLEMVRLQEPGDGKRGLVVEGTFALYFSEIVEEAILSVYIATPDDVRLARKMMRKLSSGDSDAQLMIQNYLHFSRPRHEEYVAPTQKSADLVLDGMQSIDSLTKAVTRAFSEVT
ncbi:uridine kinase [Streptomyces thermocoprophilus]|jgi:uridine kinase|uniref:Uridine kinase n=1 Tax=Streptomyces thermocoprophilus TaxID=78356 RepID=A0ABV5VN81_9ACTN